APWADDERRVIAGDRAGADFRDRSVQVDRAVAVIVPAADIEIGDDCPRRLAIKLPRIAPRFPQPAFHKGGLVTKDVVGQVAPRQQVQQPRPLAAIPDLSRLGTRMWFGAASFATEVGA